MKVVYKSKTAKHSQMRPKGNRGVSRQESQGFKLGKSEFP